MLVAAIILTASIILSTEKTQAVWKSSPLALLFTGVSTQTQHDWNDVTTYAMRDTASRMMVKLCQDESGAVRLMRT